VTRAQQAVLTVLQGADGFLSAQDLHARLRAAGGPVGPVGLTSVYRAVQSLAEAGEVDEARTSTGEAGYRVCATRGHHHHLSCSTCGATVEVESPKLERWVAEEAGRHGYAALDHTLEITGTCSACHEAQR